jgi:single stranded DNA-binding protein
MRTLNKFFILGYVGSEPKSFGNTCKVSVSTTHVWTDAKGTRQEEVEWTPVTVLHPKTAKWIIDNVRKGDTVHVEGRVRQSTYDKNDETIYATDVIADAFDLVSRKSDRDAAKD